MTKCIVIAIAIACGITSAVLCWKVIGLVPHVSDELSYLYQGRILASGRLWVEAPAVPQAFTVSWDHILRDSRGWRSIYPPGWPLLLAAGWLIQATWLINPLLLIISIIGIFLLAKQLFDERTALFAVIAFASSPFVLMMAAGFMSHISTLCFAVWCAFFLLRGNKYDSIWAAATGAFAFSIRPYTAVPLLLPLVAWSFYNAENKRTVLLQFAAGAFPVLILFVLYNNLLFGALFRTGYYYDPDAAFRGSLQNNLGLHVPWYFSNLNHTLWGWPWPDLLIFVPLLLPHRNWKPDLILAVCFFSLLIAYSVFYYRDIVYSGPRYLFESLGFLAILAGRSIHMLEEKLRSFVPVKTGPWMLLLFVYPLLFALPSQIAYHGLAYHGQSKEFLDLVEKQGIGENALVLISGDPHVFRTFYLENDLKPGNSERVYARDIPVKQAEILNFYGREEIWKMQIELRLLKGVNHYPDRAEIKGVKFERIR